MRDVLERLGLSPDEVHCGMGGHGAGGDVMESRSPATGEVLGRLRLGALPDYEAMIERAQAAFGRWRVVPAPVRGELARRLGLALRAQKDDLGRLVTLEMGKILPEGLGEVQEAIDMADFATGLSRQLYGLSMHSERPGHRMYEQWHPLGLVGVITAFNFPAAVWAWNALVATVCGDIVIWKPSRETPLVAIALHKIAERVATEMGHEGLFHLVIAGHDVSGTLVRDRRIPLISATASCRVGRMVGQQVAQRLGRSILELGGNNAIIVWKDADLDLAVRAVLFGAVGTAGQRCTSTRRVLVHKEIVQAFTERLVRAYAQVSIGNPISEGTLMGPLVNARAVETMMAALETAKAQGGEVLCGGGQPSGAGLEGGHYVEPTIVRARADMEMVQEETFAPILYLLEVEDLDEAIRVQNGVPQGLSSAVFTRDLQVAERFLSPAGSDCGIANVNIGTSGAEIGGAFGGEKDTGGGREAGSDSWKAYMRRQTCTINHSDQLPLAQGIRFG